MITKEMIEKAGITRLELARLIDMPYGTLSSKINGFVPWSQEEEEKVMAILNAAEKQDAK